MAKSTTLKRTLDSYVEGSTPPAVPPVKKPRASTKKTASEPGKCGMTKKELGDAIQSGLNFVPFLNHGYAAR